MCIAEDGFGVAGVHAEMFIFHRPVTQRKIPTSVRDDGGTRFPKDHPRRSISLFCHSITPQIETR